MIALSIAYLPYDARVLRSVALRERNLPYIQACYVEGLPTRTITGRHLLPNIMPFVVVQATLSFGYALVDLAAISYLASAWPRRRPSGASWSPTGRPRSSPATRRSPSIAGLLIIATVVAFNLLGDRLATRFSVTRAERARCCEHPGTLHVDLPVGRRARGR